MFDKVTRRDFLSYSGATLAGVTLGEAGRRLMARADERASLWHDVAAETWATSVCRECPAACGVRVRLIDGTPVKLEGNPACPLSRGRLCAKGQAAIESYFDPDRLVGPARRVGRRGEGRWAPIAWTEAIDILAARLEGARKSSGAITAMAAEERGPLADAWSRFWVSLHGRVLWTRTATAARLAPHLAALTGVDGDPVFDLEHATYVLSFGAPIVEDWLSPVWAQRSYGRFRRRPSGPRGRLVQVEGRRSLTARKADGWLPVAGDRHATLAYGVASVLLRENRVDRGFLNDVGGNVADFERDIVARFTPDSVAVATGVPVVTLLRLARDLVATPQPLVVVAADAPSDLVDAVLALNALIGAIDRPGGVAVSTAAPGDVLEMAAVAELTDLANGVEPGRVAVLHDASPLRALSAPSDTRRLLGDHTFVVSLSPYLDEAASVADLLLPTHTTLESWHALRPPAADRLEKVTCAARAVPARLDTRDPISLLRAVAEKLGGPSLAAFPWKSAEDIVNTELDGLWQLRRGVPYASAFETEWVRQLENGGWWVPPATSRRGFGEAVLQAGGWLDPFAPASQIRHALADRGGLTFGSPAVETRGAVEAGLSRTDLLTVSLGGTLTPTPEHEFPLRLLAFTPACVNLAGNPNQAVLFELLGQPEGAPWRVWVELGADTAQEHGVEHGATVRVTSANGSIDAVATVVERMASGTVAVAYVPAVSPAGRWAQLIADDVRRLFGTAGTTSSTAVRIARV